NSSSPPDGSTARTLAAAPQRSQRSRAVRAGRVSVDGVMRGSLHPSRHRRCQRVTRCALPLLLQTNSVGQVFPASWDVGHAPVSAKGSRRALFGRITTPPFGCFRTSGTMRRVRRIPVGHLVSRAPAPALFVVSGISMYVG